jgi:hypothetical protein
MHKFKYVFNQFHNLFFMGVITIKGGKEVVECNEKLYLYYFEE